MASPTTITLASTSPLKRAAVAKFFNVPLASVNCVSCESLNLPPQPINSGKKCAKARLKYLESLNLTSDYLVAIENDIEEWFEPGYPITEVEDKCHVFVKHFDTNYAQYRNCSTFVPKAIFDEAIKRAEQQGLQSYRFEGISVTAGSVVHSMNPSIPADDWIGDYSEDHITREEQIHCALIWAFSNPAFTANVIAHKVTVIPDFPKPGVRFKDLSALISDANDFKELMKVSNAKVDDTQLENFTKVVGLDARGFIYGSALAASMKTGFVMARKAGKLPGSDLVSVEYTTEYSRETLQMRRDAIQDGDKVIVCDDLVATGGSLKAACDLVALAGGKVVACVVMLAVEPLLDQARALLGDIPLIVVLPEAVSL